MVKKNKNPLNIDFKKCIVEDCLLQVRDVTNIDKPELSTYGLCFNVLSR